MTTSIEITVDHEFPDGDLDSICIRADLVDVIAEALSDEPLSGTDEGVLWEAEGIEYWLGEGERVLAALVARGLLRRSDFSYQGRAVRTDGP